LDDISHLEFIFIPWSKECWSLDLSQHFKIIPAIHSSSYSIPPFQFLSTHSWQPTIIRGLDWETRKWGKGEMETRVQN